jgi:hypothetical protein
MAHAFKVIPARPVFQQIQSLNYASDYLLEKKRLLRLRRDPVFVKYDFETYLDKYKLRNEFNRSNLLYNLYSKENLNLVTTVASNPKDIKINNIDPTLKPFYQYYVIDPKGQLFGKSQCGELNFVRYMETIKETI